MSSRKTPNLTPSWFLGWQMVAIAAAAFFVSAPGQSYSVAAFKGPMRESLALTDTQFSLAYTVATIVSGLMLPVVGVLLDRHGASRVLPLLTLLLAAACAGMSWVGGLATLCLGMCCVRSLGQGAMTLSGNWLIGEWFVRRRGLATAIGALGGSLSVLCVPLFNERAISTLGWRWAWVVLGAGVVGLMFVPSLLAIRDRPEDEGLAPDGDPPRPPMARTRPDAEPASPNARGTSVLRELRFWAVLAPIATTAMVITGLVFHSVSILGERGLSRSVALSLVSAQALVALAGTPVAGWLTDRLGARAMLAASMACLLSGPLLALAAPNRWALAAYVATLGAAEAANRTAGVTVWLDYYGRTGQGMVRGLAMAGTVFGAAIGPLPLAVVHDISGGYGTALVAFAALAACAGLAVLATPAAGERC
ncbi:MAG: MFS transporter [Planctomycetota bacterium]